MTRLIIPTRNRSASLLGVLRYLERFYPGSALVIADGSNDFHRAQNRANIKGMEGSLNVTYRAYPEELPLFDRLLDTIQNESDDFFIIGADDDFPMLETFSDAEGEMRANPECSITMASLVNLFLLQDDQIEARLNPARNIKAPAVEDRVKQYSLWPVSTTYGVTRRDVLLERYDRVRKVGMTGFFDFTVGVYDVTRGTMSAIPKIGFISTRNYKHSYWRPEDDLFFLQHSNMVLDIHGAIADDMMKFGGMDELAANKLAGTAIKRRLTEHLGIPSHRRPGFTDSPMFKNQSILRQCQIFNDLFTAGTEVRKTYQKRLDFISMNLRQVVSSEDNLGESKKYFDIGSVVPDAPQTTEKLP